MRLLLFVTSLLISVILFGQHGDSVTANVNNPNQYSLFLKGEYHEYERENEQSLWLLTQHLYKHNNVRFLVFEWGPDFIYLVNRYMETQNDSLLFKNTLVFSKAFWNKLASHNRSKTSIEKIQIFGFDFNRNVFTARAFHEMIKSKPIYRDSVIWLKIKEIIQWENKKWTWEGQETFVEQMKVLRQLCKTQEAALTNYFGNDWTNFFAILNHEVESTPQVRRDQQSVVYVKEFLSKKGEGNVLFNLGVNHTYFDHAGMGNLLQQDKHYRNQVCSIYPYHLISENAKPIFQQEQDQSLPKPILSALQSAFPFSLIDLSKKGIFPKDYKKAQWVYVIPKVETL